MKQARIILQIVLALLLVVATVAFVLEKSEVNTTENLDSHIKIEKTFRTDKPNWKHPLGDVHFLPAQFSNHLFHFKLNDSKILHFSKKNSLQNINTHS